MLFSFAHCSAYWSALSGQQPSIIIGLKFGSLILFALSRRVSSLNTKER